MGRLRARTGHAFDLPTESEWEYAGRAGVGTSLHSGMNVTEEILDPNLSPLGRYVWNGGFLGINDRDVDASGGTAKVGSYLPNAWGLYDIHGNVEEWCLDNYGAYPPGPVANPRGAAIPSGQRPERVWRGGAFDDGPPDCRLAVRDRRIADHVFMNLGFRVAVRAGM